MDVGFLPVDMAVRFGTPPFMAFVTLGGTLVVDLLILVGVLPLMMISFGV